MVHASVLPAAQPPPPTCRGAGRGCDAHRPPGRVVEDRDARPGSTSSACGLRAVGVLRDLPGQHGADRAAGRCRRLLRPARPGRLRELPRPARGRRPFAGDGLVPVAPQEPEGRPRGEHPSRRELRAGDHAAVLDRARGAGPGRHPRSSPAASRSRPTVSRTSTEISRAFTGWNFAGATNWKDPEISLEPMENWGEYHDTGSKQILGGAVLPAGQTGEQDLDQVLDLLFQHPERRPVPGPAPHPAPGHVQPESRLRLRASRPQVRERRPGRARATSAPSSARC